jgi:ADP-ribose pyrophosphatase
MTDLTEHQLDSNLAYDGKLLHVRSDTVRLPDGSRGTREYIVHPGAVMAIPVFENGDVLIERQFRYPLGTTMIEFPAGKIDAGEDPFLAIQRELLEETGYVASDWQHFHSHHPLIAYSTERIEFYVARGLSLRAPQLDAGEFLEVERVAAATLFAWILSGQVTDGKTVAGAYLAQAKGLLKA